MKKYIKKSIVILIVVLTSQNSYSQATASILLTQKNNSTNQVNIQISLTSNSANSLYFANKDCFYIEDSVNDLSSGDCVVQLKTTSSLGQDSIILPTIDHDFLLTTANCTPTTLTNGQSILYSFGLETFFELVVNRTYKVRIRYKLSKYNPGQSNVYSNWLTFTY